jgi:hypothetical protein
MSTEVPLGGVLPSEILWGEWSAPVPEKDRPGFFRQERHGVSVGERAHIEFRVIPLEALKIEVRGALALERIASALERAEGTLYQIVEQLQRR